MLNNNDKTKHYDGHDGGLQCQETHIQKAKHTVRSSGNDAPQIIAFV